MWPSKNGMSHKFSSYNPKGHFSIDRPAAHPASLKAESPCPFWDRLDPFRFCAVNMDAVNLDAQTMRRVICVAVVVVVVVIQSVRVIVRAIKLRDFSAGRLDGRRGQVRARRGRQPKSTHRR